ncbi:hypothetical protein ACFSR7_30025 [Cohnella sp. GCM10020058]|uniref:hypothetical protein n=1 Tax=Cohnella sp. GCM10020058 TaxID=3317330 RepID=UPI0036274ADF
MHFTARLSMIVGSHIEVYQESQFISGVLLDVTPGTLVVQAVENSYTQVSGTVEVVSSKIHYIRILP